jgi:hypothetical protein
MRGIPFVFFAAAALSVLCGMVWGIAMSISQDHSLSPAHAHLNLIGWVTMGLFGIYYALTPSAATARLARVHAALAILGLVMIVPGIVLAITGRGEAVAAAGSMVTLASMAVFVWTLFRHGIGVRA